MAWLLVALGVLTGVTLYRLGSLTGGLSPQELIAASTPVGWHGIYNQPLDLPLKLVRSAFFWLFPAHGQLVTRLPNAILGALAIVTFTLLIRCWHGRRVAILAGLLFATSAWVLHVSRLASPDVLYLWAVPTLLLTNYLVKKYGRNPLVWYGNLLVWGMMLYVPGLIWLVAISAYLQRQQLAAAWQHFRAWWQRALYLLFGLIWLPLLIDYLARTHNFVVWLGVPPHLAGPLNLVKQLAGVPLHLFIRGPEYPELWLGRAPILDVFTLTACAVGIYFYATHLGASRPRLLGLFAATGLILVASAGPVGLSLLVSLLYVCAATGVAYLLRHWMRVFPNNPLARGLGLGLIALVVGLAAAYNLRAYFVAWPHNRVTQAVFRQRL